MPVPLIQLDIEKNSLRENTGLHQSLPRNVAPAYRQMKIAMTIGDPFTEREHPDIVLRSEERRVGKECRYWRDWSSDVCSSDLDKALVASTQAWPTCQCRSFNSILKRTPCGKTQASIRASQGMSPQPTGR